MITAFLAPALTRLPSDNIWHPQSDLPPPELIRYASIQIAGVAYWVLNRVSSVRLRIRSSCIRSCRFAGSSKRSQGNRSAAPPCLLRLRADEAPPRWTRPFNQSGAGFLALVVLAHVCETRHLFP